MCVYANGKTQERGRDRRCRREGADVESRPRCGVVHRHGPAGGSGRGRWWKCLLFRFLVDVGSGHQERARLGKGV